jgi:SAM-dependent methyltransferase
MCDSDSIRIILGRPHRGRQWALARCRDCELHFTVPAPSDADLVAFYQGDYHSSLRVKAGAGKAFNIKYQRYVDALSRYLRAGRVLDFGCSTGLLVRILRDHGYEAEGIEMNAQSAEWGRANYGVVIHSEPLEYCSYGRGSLDAVLFTDVLEHTKNPRDTLREAWRLLAPGGIVLVTFPDIRSIESRYQYFLARLFRREWLWGCCHIPLHVWEFTRATAAACFESASFEIVEFRRNQPAPESADGLVLTLLSAPIWLLYWLLPGRWFGTQMEFILRKKE